MAAFRAGQLHRGDGSRHTPAFGSIPLIAWRDLAERDGHEVVESLCAFAMPSGITQRVAYEALRGMIVADLQAAGPVDLVLLFLHGAMVADGYDDCEGDVITHVRAFVGPDVPIAVEIDLHCHLTPAMLAGASAIVAFKEYPHTDMAERAAEVYAIGVAAAAGRLRPVMAMHDCRMVSVWRTTAEPMRSFVQRMAALEGHGGILSVSFGHGFAWADVADVGARMLVVADGDEAAASALARNLAGEVWAMRHATLDGYDTVDAALDRLAGHAGPPLVLADVADNAGAGAPSDNTTILRPPGGSAASPTPPLAWCGTPLRCSPAARRAKARSWTCGSAARPGQAPARRWTRGSRSGAWPTTTARPASAAGVRAWGQAPGCLWAASKWCWCLRGSKPSTPMRSPGLGITLHDKQVVVVKSMQHFYAGFAPVAGAVRYVAAPGAVPPEFGDIPYTKRTAPYWPKVEDPFAGSNAATAP